jgi:nephrocystin-4
MCFSNFSDQVLVEPSGPFKLLANSLNELVLLLRPGALDTSDIQLNVVHSSLPAVTKVFDIVLPKGRTANKRVSYTNPFLHAKTLCLRTNAPELVQFKESVLELEPGTSQFIGLKFAPCSTLKSAQVLIFLNNEFDRIEECLCVKIKYE